MFPVFDHQGRPIAFGGRTLKNEDAKYINSPETAAYVKGRNLFGLNLTRDEIRRSGFAILVEGFLDLIVPYQSGVKNIVASLGTALTSDQVKLISRFARKVVVNYDGDRAGVQAAKKSIEILLAEDLEVKVLVLPDGADPDEYIRKFGVTEYQRRRAQAQPHIQFVIENALRGRNLHRPAEKGEAVEEVLPYIKAVNSSVQKREYFDMAMDALRITDATLRRELWMSLRSRSPIIDAKQRVQGRRTATPTIAEQRLLELLFADDRKRDEILAILRPEDYEDLMTAPIFRAVIELTGTGERVDFDSLSQKTEPDNIPASLIATLMMGDSGKWDTRELHAINQSLTPAECVFSFRVMKVQDQIEQLKSELAEAERAEDAEKVAALSNEFMLLSQKRQRALVPISEAHPTEM